MIIYNVTVKVDNQVADAWVKWMKTEHMADVLSTGLFSDCRLSRLLEQDESEGITYSAQYFCNSINEYNDYIEHHSAIMREKGQKLFGGRFAAFRTIMEII
jgi:Domain of unknown function (DUF4286)